MINLRNVTKMYDNTYGIKKVSFIANDAEIVLLLGKNGAGKTTTIKSILNLHDFDGEIEIDGISNKNMLFKSNVGYVPDDCPVFNYLTVWEHMEFIAVSHKMENWKNRANKILETYKLSEYKNKLAKELSHGNKQKLSLATALLYDPKNLICDEPIIGLDPASIKSYKKELLKLKSKGKCILLSTHLIDVFSGLWDKAIIIEDGQIVRIVDSSDKNLDLEEYFS